MTRHQPVSAAAGRRVPLLQNTGRGVVFHAEGLNIQVTPCSEYVRYLDRARGLPLSAEAALACLCLHVTDHQMATAAAGRASRGRFGSSDTLWWPEFERQIRECVSTKPHSLVVEATKAAEAKLGSVPSMPNDG